MKRALVTGGSGALGEAVCRALAADGHHVVVHANQNLERARTIVQSLTRQGASAEAICFDVTDVAGSASALAELVTRGPIQILVNNAGVHDDAPLAGMRREQWKRVIDVTLYGFFNVTQPLLLEMMATRWGRIVNVSSVSALAGNAGQTNYAAAKAGLIGATKSLALEVARRGITVNAVAPGIVAAGMGSDGFSQERIEALVPMRRAGTAEEVASLVRYLVTDAASYLSGQTLSVNGAMLR